MRTRLLPPNFGKDPGKVFTQALEHWIAMVRHQPRVVHVSYGCGLLGALLSVHDYHHYHADRFGLSTPLLGVAILLYLYGRRR